MPNVNEETINIIDGFKSIVEVPSMDGNSQFDPKTSDAIRQTIDVLEKFIEDGTPGGFPALNGLLSNIIIRFSGDINSNKEFKVAEELSHTLKGKSGEHFVAAELFRRNTIVALPPQNTPLFDLIVTSPDGAKTLFIQVKTTIAEGTYGVSWHLSDEFKNKKNRDDLYLVLVDARKQPEYFIFQYDIFVDIFNKILALPSTERKTKVSGKRIFLSFADTFHQDIANTFWSNTHTSWDDILTRLQ